MGLHKSVLSCMNHHSAPGQLLKYTRQTGIDRARLCELSHIAGVSGACEMLSVLTVLFSFYHSDEISKHHWKLWRNRVLNMILQGVLSIKIAQKSLKMVKSPKFFGACGGQKGARYARQPKMATPPCTITPVTPLVVVAVPGQDRSRVTQ